MKKSKSWQRHAPISSRLAFAQFGVVVLKKLAPTATPLVSLFNISTSQNNATVRVDGKKKSFIIKAR